MPRKRSSNIANLRGPCSAAKFLSLLNAPVAGSAFPWIIPNESPSLSLKSRSCSGLTIVEEPHIQQTTVEDADETDEEQEEDEEDTEDNLPPTHSPFTAGQYTPPLTLEEATTALEDLRLFIQPRRTSGIGHKDPKLDLLLRSRLEKMRMHKESQPG